MPVMVVQQKDNFWLGINSFSFVVGQLYEKPDVRKVHLERLLKDIEVTILDVRHMKKVTVQRLVNKYFNGMGSFLNEDELIDGFTLAGAKKISVEDLL